MEKDISVSIAKGIGITLMVAGHALIPIGVDFIYMFHMPLFFILSGYCFKEKYLNEFATFVKRKAKGLYIPFVKWSLLFLVLHNVLYHLNMQDESYTLDEITHKFVFGTLLFIPQENLLGAYWFLPQLFFASILGLVIIRYVKNIIIGISLLMAISAFLAFYYSWGFPYTSVSSLSFFSAAFFVIGYAIKKHSIKSKGVGGFFCFGFVFIGSVLWKTNMDEYTILNMLPYLITATLGTLMIIQLSEIIAKRLQKTADLLVFVGNNTLPIVTWHLLCFKLVTLIIVLLWQLPEETLLAYPAIDDINLIWILYVFAGIVIPMGGVVMKERITKSIRYKNKITSQI